MSKHMKLFMLLFAASLGFGSALMRADDLEQAMLQEESFQAEEEGFDENAKRGYLSVPSAVGATCDTLTVELLTTAALGNTTTNLCRCKLYKTVKSIYYVPAAVNSCPMIRMTASGATLDMCHTCLSFCRTGCDTHCVGIEVGYSPQDLANDSTLSQPNSITIENGLMSRWDMAIVVHAGVRNVTIRNMVFTDNVIPIVILGQNDEDGVLTDPVCSVTLENVSIVGGCNEYRACLDWIRAIIANGVLSDSSTTSQSSYGYNNSETMPCVCDPISDTRDGAFVYTGVYAYGAQDLRLKNVHVSGLGFDQNIVQDADPAPVPAILAERTVTYGMWFRKSKSIFMQDVTSTKNKSSLGVAGVMFDESQLISVKNSNFGCNAITVQENGCPNPVNCCDGIWAAGVVMKDSHTASLCDVVLSDNRGIDNVWGYRTILSAVYDNGLVSSSDPAASTTPAGRVGPTIDLYNASSQNLIFENVYADSLRGDRVYGFDFADKCRNLYTSITGEFEDGTVFTTQTQVATNSLPVGAVHKLSMNNVSVCAAQGKIVGDNTEAEIAKEFKGICLGDQSSGICMDCINIGANKVVFDETCDSQVGFNSGIEFGGQSTLYQLSSVTGPNNDLADLGAQAAAATGQAQGTINDLRMNKLKITNNLGGSDVGRMVAIRAVATGSNTTYGPGLNTFSDITLTNSSLNMNQFDGLRAIDDVSGEQATPVVLTDLKVDNTTFNSSVDGYGFNANTVTCSTIKNANFNQNHIRGFAAANVNAVDFSNISVCDTDSTPANLCDTVVTEVYGFDISGAAQSVRIDGGRFNGNTAVDAHVAGLHVNCGGSVDLKDVQADLNTSSSDAGDGPYLARGLYFETKVNSLGLTNVQANNNCANNGNATGIQVDRATSVHACNVKANNNKAEGAQCTNGNVSTAMGMFFKATIGSKTSEGCLMKDLQACGNTNAHLAYGIYMQEPVGLVIEGIDGSSNVSSATRALVDGQANPFELPILSQAVGIYFEGGSAVHMIDVHASSNVQKEGTAAYLSRHIEKGLDINDSEAVKNISSEIAHHFPVANRSGAYGIFADGTQDISIEGGSACNNFGVRAFGVHARFVDNFCMHKFDTLENHGFGTPFINDNPFNLRFPNQLDTTVQSQEDEANPNSVDVADAQAECIFGGIDPASKVDMKEAYSNFLINLKRHGQGVIASDLCAQGDPCSSSTSSADACVAPNLNLLWATLAPCRRFCSGAGIGMYSSNYAIIDECRAMGNYSLCDSGGGFVFYGKGEGHTITKSVAANNEGYRASERGGIDSFHIDGDIDNTKWTTVYRFLDVGLLESETVNIGEQNDTYGFELLPEVVIKSDHIDETQPPTPNPQRKPTANTQGLLIQPEGTTSDNYALSNRRMTVAVIPTGSGISDLRIDLCDFVGFGPIGVGILLECQRDCNVADNNTYGNKGHAGLGFGILADGTSASMFIDNKATNNAADALGYAWGLVDLSMSSPNVWYKNWMYANRVDTFMNSSYLINFDNAVSAGQSLPVKEIFPGSIESLVNSLPLDNIVIRFLSERQEFDCVGNLVTNKWMATDVLSCGM